MSQTRARLGRHSLVLAIVILSALALAAPAAMAGSVSYDVGDTVVYTAGDNGNHIVQFRYNATTGQDEILDNEDFESFPSDCTYPNSLNSWISCPPHNNVRIELGAGNDSVTTVQDCFFDYVVNLGGGTNDNDMNTGCPDPVATATINGGSGDDTLRGGSAGTTVTLNGNGGADTLNGMDGPTIIHGGDGNDGVFGGAGNDQVFGEGGDDRVRGHEGNDLEDGGPGNDDIGFSPGVNHDSDPGADVTVGGPGTDKLRLSGHNGGMAISLDGQANDGTPGEGDNVGSDIEEISGTTGNDTFIGSEGADDFSGDQGEDDIHGGGGNDTLFGGGGDDKVYGDAGNDKVQGASGADRVDGGPGSDQLYGDIGSCSVYFCSFDADQLFARDGERDSVDCGDGADTAHVDQLDVVAFCASVDRETVAPPKGGGLAKPNFGSSKKAVKVSRGGRFAYSFKAGAGLKGKAAFGKLATKSFKVPKSGRVTLKMRLSAKKMAPLRAKGKIKIKVTVTLKNAAGGSSVASTNLTLKR
jgi:Ca2+-binding RTX toxin-like protein